MSTVRYINFDDLCRICTASGEHKIHAFSAEAKSKNLVMKILDCLALHMDEKDRLPKMICLQCQQHIETMYQFRIICKNSQAMLKRCLSKATLQNGEKIYIKDAISIGGKSLSVLSGVISDVGNNSQLPTIAPIPSNTLTIQAPTAAATTMQNSLQNNDLLNTIIQAVENIQHSTLNTQQYTITLDKGFKDESMELKIDTAPEVTTQSLPKIDKNSSTLEQFIKLKPDLKITPLGKKDTNKQPIKQNSPEQQSNASQIRSQAEEQQQQANVLLQQQLQQLQQIQQQWQHQQLQQQLQQLTSQFQVPSQITITTPATTASQNTCSINQTDTTTILNDDLSPSRNKKPKLNFVFSSPSSQNINLSQLAVNTGTQPQIQLQIQPSPPQQSQPINTATLLSNLTSQTSNSTNKCFLPITIRDENSEQHIVAQIDSKNFVLPTTYQLQMKLQPQLATADGQPIMQLTPTSIPATLQLTPQAINQTFKTTTNNSDCAPIQAQFMPQNSFAIEQQRQNLQPTAQVTSQQIIRPANNDSLKLSNITSNTFDATNQSALSQERYKISQQSGTNVIEITPTTNFTHQIMEQVKKQQLQKQAKQQEIESATSITTPTAKSVTTTQPVTMQRMQAKSMAITKVPAAAPTIATVKQNSQTQQQISVSSGQTKLPLINKQNITISRITSNTTTAATNTLQQKQLSSITMKQKSVAMQQQRHSPQQQQRMQQCTQKQLQVQDLKAQSQQVTKVESEMSQLPVKRRDAVKQISKTTVKRVSESPITIATTAMPAPLLKTQAPTIQAATEITSAITNVTSESSAIKGVSNSIAVNPVSTNLFICSTCERSFKKREHLTQHVKLHAGLRPFKCDQENCNKDFNRKEHLSRHLISHSGKKMFSCDICQKPFSRKDNLNKHKRVHDTQASENLYKCETCKKTFAVKTYYEKHKEIHAKPNASATETATVSVANASDAVTKSQEKATQNQNKTPAAAPQKQQLQILQHSVHSSGKSPTNQQQQIMHVQLQPHVVTTQDAAGNTITITQASDNNLNSYVQLGLTQFQQHSNRTSSNQIVCKIEK